MQTLTRERRKKFEDEIQSSQLHYYARLLLEQLNTPEYVENTLRECREALASALADASLSRSEVRGIEAAIFADRPVTEEDMEEKTIRAATNEFESALGCGQFPWDSTAVWTKFRKWVVEIYKFTPTLFREYNQWRDGEGKFGDAMRNPKIRENPEAFMTTGWATFMSKSRKTDESKGVYKVDENGVPENY